jgi:plastocyanin
MIRLRPCLVERTLLAAVAALVPCAVFGVDQTVQVGPGMTFSPANVTVAPGDTVTWNFNELHTSTSDPQIGPETWDSGQLSSGTFSHTFNTPGTYPYHCFIHSFPGGTLMNGVVEVSGVGPTPTPTATPPTQPTPTATFTPPGATPTATFTPPGATPTATPTLAGVATPTATPTTPAPVTPTATPPPPGPSATPVSGVAPAGIPDLDAGGRALLAVALAAAGIAALLLTRRR